MFHCNCPDVNRQRMWYSYHASLFLSNFGWALMRAYFIWSFLSFCIHGNLVQRHHDSSIWYIVFQLLLDNGGSTTKNSVITTLRLGHGVSGYIWMERLPPRKYRNVSHPLCDSVVQETHISMSVLQWHQQVIKFLDIFVRNYLKTPNKVSFLYIVKQKSFIVIFEVTAKTENIHTKNVRNCLDLHTAQDLWTHCWLNL